MEFELLIQPPALDDIQEAIDYYDFQKDGLGEEFEEEEEVNNYLISISKTKFFQVRYDEVRCLPLKRFPYMIHYSVDEDKKLIIVRAVFNTHRSPEIWKERD
jgi:hypothetical protein